VTSRGTIARALAGLGLVCASFLALASSIVLHGAGVLVVLLTAGAAASVGYMAQHQGRAAAVERASKAAAATVAVIVLVTGVVVLAGGVVAALISAIAVGIGGALWILKHRPAWRDGARARGATPVTEAGNPAPVLASSSLGPLQPPVSLLGTADLGLEWLRTTSALASAVESAARQQIIERRQETLDELERRDPAGFARWLAAGAAGDSDPATFVRAGRTTRRDAA
jgi:uncharacterized membrane protein YphA (DoxX/SURF4 family)